MRNAFWTALVRETYSGLSIYLLEFSVQAAIDLDDQIERLVERLARYNFSCPPAPKLPRFRRCVVSKNTSLLYQIRDEEIFIVGVVDNRADHLYF